MLICINSNMLYSLYPKNCHRVLTIMFFLFCCLLTCQHLFPSWFILNHPRIQVKNLCHAVTCNRLSPRRLESIGEVLPMRTAGHHLLCIVVAIAFVLESVQSLTAVLKCVERIDDSSVLIWQVCCIRQQYIDPMACRWFFHCNCTPFEGTLT